ncbi:MAG: hypothetical protein M3P84_11570 [Chloroflexota bacterium]|nr:hypothetical protein [Chloroflexota bacterium]
MSHPTLGLPPPDMTAGFPEAAKRLSQARDRVAARALERALAADPTLRERYDEVGLRLLLRDARGAVDELAKSLASADPSFLAEWADQVAPIYRRRRVPMDDLIALADGLRLATESVVAPGEREPIDTALDQTIVIFRKYRRLAGDARKRNRFLQFIYKGA